VKVVEYLLLQKILEQGFIIENVTMIGIIKKTKMVNKNYVKGRNKEYKIINNLKSTGCDITFRSAGSHSSVDCVGINTTDRLIYLIQSKPKSMSVKKKQELRNKMPLDGTFIAYWRVI
jgi:hypothetical protein